MKRIVCILGLLIMPISMAMGSNLLDGLVGYWPFDGNANDMSGNENNGTLHGTTFITDRHGNTGHAMYFGTENYIEVANSSSLNSIGNSITIAAWIKVNSWHTTGQRWAALLSKGSYQYCFNLTPDDTSYGTEVGNGVKADFTGASLLGKWVHVAVSYGSDKICRAYVNGHLHKSKSCPSGSFPSSSAPLIIGKHPPQALEFFIGAMDELFIYNRQLSSSEIKALCNFSLPENEIHSVVFVPNTGTGEMEDQVFEEGKEEKLPKNTYTKDGYVFQGWAETKADADNGFVKYRDEALITVDHDMTLYAVWENPALTLMAESADWSSGSITLCCTDADTSGAAHTYMLQYYDENNTTWGDVTGDDATVSIDSDGNAHLADKGFSSRLGGIPPVKYRVKDENGRVSAECVTRNRYGLFVGVGHYSAAYQAKIRIRRGRPLSELPEIEGNTRRYSNLAQSNGRFSVTELIETDAKVKKVNDAFADIAEKVIPGDVCLFYASTHGDFDGNVAVLRLYDDDYNDSRLRTGTDLISAKGAAVVCVLAACCSEAMVRQSTANVAVIAAANYKGSTTALFDEILWDYGWKDGWAGTGANLTFGDLSDYVANRYNAIFEGVTFNSPDGAETWNVQIDNAPLLARITAGTRGTHASQNPPSPPSNMHVDQAVQRDRIALSWNGDQDADNYFIFFGGAGGGTYDDFDETNAVNNVKFKMEFKADDYECVERSSGNTPVSFMIRAFNGAGVSSATNVQGWVDNRRRVTLDPQGGMFPGRLPGESYVLDYRKGDGLGILPPASKAGFTFAYWYRDNKAAVMTEIATEGTVVTDDVTYIAWWTDMTETYLNQHANLASAANGDIATAAAMTAANGCRTVGECYALGIDPEDPNDDFKIIDFRMDGDKPVITLNHTEDGSGNSFEPRIKTLGKANVTDAEWREVPENGDATMRFFKVTVEIP